MKNILFGCFIVIATIVPSFAQEPPTRNERHNNQFSIRQDIQEFRDRERNFRYEPPQERNFRREFREERERSRHEFRRHRHHRCCN